MNLPQDFCLKMQNLLKDEYDDFIKGYDNENYFSLRINTLKADSDDEKIKNLFCEEKVRWAENGYYYSGRQRPGKHPYHHAGAYYIQEASAMAPVARAEIQKGDRVLDLCAAPGGKSTGAAAYLEGTGLLVSNEIVPGRAKILSGNIERMGVKNAVVTNESPGDLERYFPHFFDKIIVDAPCSGEGMFRKDKAAADQWSREQVNVCANPPEFDFGKCGKNACPGRKNNIFYLYIFPGGKRATDRKFFEKTPGIYRC